MHKLMQIECGLSPPMLLGAVVISVLLQAINVLLEPGDNELLVGGKATLSFFF